MCCFQPRRTGTIKTKTRTRNFAHCWEMYHDAYDRKTHRSRRSSSHFHLPSKTSRVVSVMSTHRSRMVKYALKIAIKATSLDSADIRF